MVLISIGLSEHIFHPSWANELPALQGYEKGFYFKTNAIEAGTSFHSAFGGAFMTTTRKISFIRRHFSRGNRNQYTLQVVASMVAARI